MTRLLHPIEVTDQLHNADRPQWIPKWPTLVDYAILAFLSAKVLIFVKTYQLT